MVTIDMQYIIVTGNPIDGLEFWGPFTDDEGAKAFACEQRLNNWWIATLLEPIEPSRID